jgi:2-polyprenyl-3-methyl-5-hydroxy-6-metoxy-1,4-benzoquinol methylase
VSSHIPIPENCLSVVVPAYNEAGTILESIGQVLLQPFVREIVVVDDASTDETSSVLDLLDDPRVRVLRHAANQGKGAALRTGFGEVLGPYVAIHDADLEYDPSDLARLLAPLVAGDADVVYGSRFLTGDARRVLFFWHSLGNQFLTLLSNAATNLNLSDMETCYKVFRKEVLDSIVIEESRFGFEPEVTVKVATARWRVYEVGISYRGRTYEEGKKIGWRDGAHAVRCIVQYSVREKARSRRIRRLEATGELEALRGSLEDLKGADNYYDWIGSLLIPHLDGHVLEVGAGSGTVTRQLTSAGLSVTAIEPDPDSFAKLQMNTASDERVVAIHGTSFDVVTSDAGAFGGAVLINVLEHISDDKGELKRVAALLQPGSPILIWVPANELLYSKFDLAVGHYRRYSRKNVEAVCAAAGLVVESSRYVNAPGALAWGVVAKAAGRAPTEGRLTQTYDTHVVPKVRAVESRISMPFGQSLLVVARTRGAIRAQSA